jgi:hypothetical protein
MNTFNFYNAMFRMLNHGPITQRKARYNPTRIRVRNRIFSKPHQSVAECARRAVQLRCGYIHNYTPL